MIEYDYYRAFGPSHMLLAKFHAARRHAIDICSRLAAEHGAVGMVRRGTRIVGFEFAPSAIAPEGLRASKGYWYPALKSKAGRLFAARLALATSNAAFPDGDDLAVALMGEAGGWRMNPNGTMSRHGPEYTDHLGENYYVAMRAGDPPPKDCVAIKRSEYHRLAEERDEAKALEASAP